MKHLTRNDTGIQTDFKTMDPALPMSESSSRQRFSIPASYADLAPLIIAAVSGLKLGHATKWLHVRNVLPS
jgi:hypothetical protein